MTKLPVIECCAPLAGSPLPDRRAKEMASVFRSLADGHRLKIVNLLLRAGGEAVCVCEIQPALGLSQGTVSYHLKQLVDAGLISRTTRGTFSYYSLVPGALDAVSDVLEEPAART